MDPADLSKITEDANAALGILDPIIKSLQAAKAAQPQSPAEFAMMASRGTYKMARHIEFINKKLVDLAEARIKRLILCLPPRHSKSETGSRWMPAWYLGRYPDRRIILASHEASFAATWGEKARDLLLEYGPSVFGVKISSTAASRDDWRIQGRDGGMVTVGVGGAVVGRGADLVIIDDFLRNAEDAASETIREKIWNWWLTSMMTRLEPNGVVLIIATRWSEDDLIGRLLAQQADEDEPQSEKWEIVNLPAIAEEGDALGRKVGEALWPYRYDENKLNRIQRRSTPYFWNALYQQHPMPPGGSIFKRECFRFYETMGINGTNHIYKLFNAAGNDWTVDVKECRYFIIVDSAASEKKSADFSVVQVWAVTPAFDSLLVDMWRDQARAPDVRKSIIRMYRQWKCEFAAIEKDGVGLPLLQSLRDSGLSLMSVDAKGDKGTRATGAELRFYAGQIHFPKVCMFPKELAALIDELESFPRGKHDDCVDCCSMMAAIINRIGGHGSLRDRDEVEHQEKVEAETTALAIREKAPGGKVDPDSVAIVVSDDDIEWLEG